MAISSLTGDWNKASKLLQNFTKDLTKASSQAIKQEAHLLRSWMVIGIQSGAPGFKKFKKLSGWTLAGRKFPARGGRKYNGTKPLIRGGDLIKNITVVERGDAAFVGIQRKAKAKNGKPLINIALIQEKGFGPIVIPFTPKMKKYLHYMANKAKKAGITLPPQTDSGEKKTAIVVTIPPRPFIAPSIKAWKVGAKDRFNDRMVKLLKGKFA